ncbi:exotoxin beta-grasp domain-containing protein [Mesobacillus subterraneus]|uniref:exotoxin beta-grasp domain-containing protein n=1 Tax=Mesobacillus subterraneus TaxID=285983 RepID=UPI001CFE6A50|nr:exotoxin beta-grasp domain-containing protein [Mesobacillus subterraneus]WLR57258.1 exotoxin beta-grasp domain-containing protein [Mesobacillus subterraneus]
MDNEQLLKIILDRFDKVDQRFNEVDHQFKEVLTRLNRIEESQQEDVKGTLQLISKKVDGIRFDVDYLSEKTGKHDTKINSLEKRIQS